MYIQKTQLREERVLEGLQILVADNQPDDLELLTFILEEDGASVVSVASLYEAIEALSYQTLNIIFASINLLKNSTLLAKVKAQALETGKEILTVAVLDTNRCTYPKTFLDMGCQTYISMPLDPTEVVSLAAAFTQRL
jgi:CheY-like chemotaxis protein